MKTRLSYGNQSGFSLIEVALAVLVIGILVGSALATYNVYMVARKDNDTKARIETIQSALSKYVASEGVYPLPADRDIPIGTAGFGKSVAAVTLPCNTSPQKACVTTGVANVYVGDVPFATLGIRYENMLNSYGRKMTYAVSQPLTVSAATFTDAGGVINPITIDASGTQYPGGPPNNPFAHYFVFSSGPDGEGAYNLAGNLVAACGTAANGTDFENCNGDNVFRSNYDNNIANAATTYKKIVRNYAAGATQFDDWSGYKNTSNVGLWNEAPGLGQLTNSNGGNVLVGTPAFNVGCGAAPCVNPPKTKLEVQGAVKATELRTGRLCYNTGACPLGGAGLPRNQLSPAHFGIVPNGTVPNVSGSANATSKGNDGGGILCGQNKSMRGWQNGDELCNNSVRAGNPNNYNNGAANGCNTAVTGLYPTGITAAGAVKCN